MSVTYKGITFVSIHDAAKFLSEPVWRVEETLYGEVGEIEQEFPFCWLLVLCLAIATAPAILALAHANQSFLTYPSAQVAITKAQHITTEEGDIER